VSRLKQLDEQYGDYHRSAKKTGFVFGGDERASLFAHLVGGPGQRVLDLGCRWGSLTRAYLEGNDVVGVDVDRHALAEAAKLGIETRWADVDQPFPFEDASFDVVVAGELIEHLRDTERFVAEVQRVLKPGGTFVGSVPNFFRLRNRLAMLVGQPLDHDPTHLHVFAPRDVRAMLRGFEHVELHFIASRFLRVSATLFANIIVFSARTPR
jgi:2-polyprenyl-3-methyl-5-hydroxy-6-metoxy-1,4-benzoquinol methylase